MKWKVVLWALLGVGLVSCTRRVDDGRTLGIESEEIGICGANADPSTGVTCRYSVNDTSITLTSSSALEFNTQDYARCTWTVGCSYWTEPRSYDGSQAC